MTAPAELIATARQWSRSQMPITAGHDWGHIERVVTNALRLADQEGADKLVVHLAALMHDLINLPKDHPHRRRASTRSAERAAQWLDGKLSPARIDGVFEAIQCHSFSAGLIPSSREAKVVSDADNLDAIGAIGIARAFEIGGSINRPLMAGHDPFCRQRTPDDAVYTLDHFYAKLLHLKTRFYTDSGRRQAQRRLAFMDAYLAQLRREIDL